MISIFSLIMSVSEYNDETDMKSLKKKLDKIR